MFVEIESPSLILRMEELLTPYFCSVYVVALRCFIVSFDEIPPPPAGAPPFSKGGLGA